MSEGSVTGDGPLCYMAGWHRHRWQWTARRCRRRFDSRLARYIYAKTGTYV